MLRSATSHPNVRTRMRTSQELTDYIAQDVTTNIKASKYAVVTDENLAPLVSESSHTMSIVYWLFFFVCTALIRVHMLSRCLHPRAKFKSGHGSPHNLPLLAWQDLARNPTRGTDARTVDGT